MAGAIIAPVLNLMREGLNTDAATVGYVLTTHGIVIAVSSPLVGVVIDQAGPRRPLVFGLLLYGLAGGAGLFIDSLWLMFLSRVLLGIAVAAVVTSITVIILNLYEGTERNKIMGWRGSSNNIGGIVWPLLGGALGGLTWHAPFAAYLAGIPLGLAAIFAVPEIRAQKAQEEDETETQDSVIRIIRSRPVLLAIFGLSLWASVLLYSIVVFIPQILEEKGITDTFHISLFLISVTLASAASSFQYAKIRGRFSYKAIIITSLALWTAGCVLIFQVPSVWVVIPGTMLLGVGFGLIGPMGQVWIGELVPEAFRGRVSAYLPSFRYIGQFASPVILGPVALSLGLRYVYLVAGGVSFIMLLLFLFGMKGRQQVL
jgi:MFS family permease